MNNSTLNKVLIGVMAAVVLIIGGLTWFIYDFSTTTSSPSATTQVITDPADASSSGMNATSTASSPAATTSIMTTLVTPSSSPAVSKPFISSGRDDVAPPAPPVLSDATSSASTTQPFVIALSSTTTDEVAQMLVDQGYLNETTSFDASFAARSPLPPAPGGYNVIQGMSVSQIVSVLLGKPALRWVVIPEGLRKEEVAALLAKTLGWTAAQTTHWITTDTDLKYDDIEGVYFPDTYLIPVNESPLDVANRLVAKFNEKFTPYLPQFNAQNIQWTRGSTLASIIQREAANDTDMPLIAGILWNRLNQNIPLDVDSTLQYARGDIGSGWWAPITIADKQINSPYNTYTNTGLPPHPISNPGLPAIDAVLHPAVTDCLYYLHDKNGIIHCSPTYAGQQANVQEYLQ